MSDLALQRSILQTGPSLDWVGRPTKPTIEEMLLVRLKLPRAWTAEEDARLARLARENGLRNWHRVSRQMPGRSHALCRDRWRDHLARDVYHRAFTAADDAELARLHQRHGGRWRYISRAVYGRTSRVMKRRWRELRRNGTKKTTFRPPALPAEDLEMELSEQHHPLADALCAGLSSCSLGCSPMDPGAAGSLALGFACMVV
ncbi:Myb-like transcription factor-like [Hordeum vulgare]|nr:Myb-like transcription factor-like [Hordeum vulgare]